ncbi:hypothetical protein CHS0354_038473 [Potamilus streckersoni]|uniref:Uncharacterized protein n=1 Tax=Potamilus streckersoni TaxID=2493646 RepID=A0AAE0VQX3_9BIVA|nr:hypothetical protein CHS0354_038473 [Potamilus streckersoni]
MDPPGPVCSERITLLLNKQGIRDGKSKVKTKATSEFTGSTDAFLRKRLRLAACSDSIRTLQQNRCLCRACHVSQMDIFGSGSGAGGSYADVCEGYGGKCGEGCELDFAVYSVYSIVLPRSKINLNKCGKGFSFKCTL